MSHATNHSADIEDDAAEYERFMQNRAQKGGAARGHKTRKKAEKKIRATASGQSLADTGRTKQFNFKAQPAIHKAVMDAAAVAGITVSEWLEGLIARELGLDI